MPVQLHELAAAQTSSLPPQLSGRRLHGVPFPGATIVSNNTPAQCQPAAPSTCDDAFIHFGVRLTSATSCTTARFDQPTELRGISYGTGDRVLLGQKNDQGWLYQCIPVTRVANEPYGTFAATVTWPRLQFAGAGARYLMLASAVGLPDGSCQSAWGWSQSARVYLTD